MTRQTPYDMFIAAGYFDRLDQALNRPDCKRARTVHRSLWAEESLRFEQRYNPLNIRISNKERYLSCLKTCVLIVVAVMLTYGALGFFMSRIGLPWDSTGTSAEASLLTTGDIWGDSRITGYDPNLDYYSVED